jgi:hypothetical protein
MTALFEYAASSIRMGVEDYSAEKPERSLSAVRNMYAGILLLAKEVLARAVPNADPDAVIGDRYKPVTDGKQGLPRRTSEVRHRCLRANFANSTIRIAFLAARSLDRATSNLRLRSDSDQTYSFPAAAYTVSCPRADEIRHVNCCTAMTT